MRTGVGAAAAAVLLVVAAACADQDASDQQALVAPTAAADPTPAETGTAADPAATTAPLAEATAAPAVELEVVPEHLPVSSSADYGLWADGPAGPLLLGRVDGGGPTTVTLPEELDEGSALLLSLESAGGAPPAAPGPILLAGELGASGATLVAQHPLALDVALAAAEGTFLLGTPTDPPAPETSGIWFLVLEPRGPSLVLPELPAGWAYQAWVTVEGVPLPTGSFTSPDGADGAAPFSGPEAGPPFPGEDFLRDATPGLSFPVDLSGSAVALLAVPDGYGGDEPVGIPVLSARVPDAAPDHVAFPMEPAAAPRVTVTRPR